MPTRACSNGAAAAGVATALAIAALAVPAEALRNGLALTPPMGWSNWEAYGCAVTEDVIKANADAVVAKGLKDAGYNIVGVDDCWAELERNSSGYLVPNANFSSGMKSLGDYLHERGLQFGIYSSAGAFCCQHTMPGSLGYEWLDAQLWASWGVDFLKYDGCYMEQFAAVLKDAPRRFPFTPPPILRYPQMAMALNHTGRNITYLCNFPWTFWDQQKDPADGGDWVGEFCHMWRTGGDAQPGFSRAVGYVDQSETYAPLVPSGPGRWNHLDSLEIGNNQSFDATRLPGGTRSRRSRAVGAATSSGDPPGMTEAQERAVFSLFVVVKSPLFIGASAVDLQGHSLATLTNMEVIRVHQDPLGARGSKRAAARACGEVWSVPNADGGAAVVLFNRDAQAPCTMVLDVTADARLDAAAHAYAVRDLWRHADLPPTARGQAKYARSFIVNATSCVMLRLTPTTAATPPTE